MRFRTELEIRPETAPLTHGTRCTTIGSCFSDAIGRRLADGGFDTDVNPMGVLFNPLSIANAVGRALQQQMYDAGDLYRDANGVYHILDFESRRQGADPEALLAAVNADMARFAARLSVTDCLLVTFGTAWCFNHLPTQRVVGNCHKLPDAEFQRSLADMEHIVATWTPIVRRFPRIIFTVSPVRHLNDGLHGNTLSKAILHLAVDTLVRQNPTCAYFPAYEALMDDLRDYRFYAADLKHPSDMAEEYIFDRFSDMFFDRDTRRAVEAARRDCRRAAHRPILEL